MTTAALPPRAPSRGPASENFPVASRLLAPAMRRPVLAFYHLARAADDIADDPALSPAEKLAGLAALDAALRDRATVLPLARALHDSGAGTAEALQLLAAFRQDAVQSRYPDWAALEAYCRLSAVPVGRLLLRLHGEADALALAAADALCIALQLLNHLQDAGEDRARLDRVYIPQDWLALAGGEARFFADPAARRPLLDALLDRLEELLDRAAELPRHLRSRRLRLEAAVTLHLARALLRRLRRQDPLAGRVALGRLDVARAFLAAPRPGPSDAALVRARVRRARSSFAAGMAASRGEARRALLAVYAFCRAVDDIADGLLPDAEKHAALQAWRQRLARPDDPASRELAWACVRFDLPLAECHRMIDGMQADIPPGRRIADAAALALYCRQVAGSVGALAVRLFGAPGAEAFGLALGQAFQQINVLRDLDEDAARDRIYLPLSLLADHGMDPAALARPAREVAADPRFALAAAALARQTLADLDTAMTRLPDADRKPLRPALLMLWGYRRLLRRLLEQGFSTPRARVRLRQGERLQLAFKAAQP